MPVTYSNEDNSALGQIGRMVNTVREETIKQQEKRKQDTMDQIKVYAQYREAGYSPEDSTVRTNRMFGAHSFLEKMVTGQGGNAFNPPQGQDKWDREEEKATLENRKTRLGLRETQAGIKEKLASAKYKTEMTGEGAHAGEKALYDEDGNIVAWVPKTSAQIKQPSEDNAFASLVEQGGQTQQPVPTGKYQAGQTVYYKGKPMKIKAVNPDGTYTL